jgi:hypothetical protein
MRAYKYGRILLLLLLAGAGIAAAAGAPRRLSVTVDPVYLTRPILQVTAEYRPVEHWSGALLAGAGSLANLDQPDNTMWEVGAQARWYPFSPSRRELHFLAQCTRRHQQDGEAASTTEVYVYDHYDTALLGGYKFILNGGFTFEAQGGLILFGTHEHGAPFSAVLRPHANLGLGWSF